MAFGKGKGKKAAAKNISEFHKGPTFKKTKKKYGAKKANKQAVAVGMKAAGMPMWKAMGKKSPMAMSGGEGSMEKYAKRRGK